MVPTNKKKKKKKKKQQSEGKKLKTHTCGYMCIQFPQKSSSGESAKSATTTTNAATNSELPPTGKKSHSNNNNNNNTQTDNKNRTNTNASTTELSSKLNTKHTTKIKKQLTALLEKGNKNVHVGAAEITTGNKFNANGALNNNNNNNNNEKSHNQTQQHNYQPHHHPHAIALTVEPAAPLEQTEKLEIKLEESPQHRKLQQLNLLRATQNKSPLFQSNNSDNNNTDFESELTASKISNALTLSKFKQHKVQVLEKMKIKQEKHEEEAVDNNNANDDDDDNDSKQKSNKEIIEKVAATSQQAKKEEEVEDEDTEMHEI